MPVAIRVLRRDEQPHWDAVRGRFLLEARTLQVGHPSVLHVRDFGEDDRSVHLVTDLIEGPSLRQAMAESGPFPWPRAVTLITQALDAMGATVTIIDADPNRPLLRWRNGKSNSGIEVIGDVTESTIIKSIREHSATRQFVLVGDGFQRLLVGRWLPGRGFHQRR